MQRLTDSYAVVPEVGKIGRSAPNYILPVAERKDGIKSFFGKGATKKVPEPPRLAPPLPLREEPSEDGKVKPYIKAEPPDLKPEIKSDIKPDISPKLHPEPGAKPDIDGLELDTKHPEIAKRDPDIKPSVKGGGPCRVKLDNAPAAAVVDISDDDDIVVVPAPPQSEAGAQSKRKRADEHDSAKPKTPRKGGRQTSIVRKEPEAKKAVSGVRTALADADSDRSSRQSRAFSRPRVNSSDARPVPCDWRIGQRADDEAGRADTSRYSHVVRYQTRGCWPVSFSPVNMTRVGSFYTPQASPRRHLGTPGGARVLPPLRLTGRPIFSRSAIFRSLRRGRYLSPGGAGVSCRLGRLT